MFCRGGGGEIERFMRVSGFLRGGRGGGGAKLIYQYLFAVWHLCTVMQHAAVILPACVCRFASSQKAKNPLILELRNLHAAESSHCISFAQFARCIL